jgi:hypothetical protein
MKKILKRLLKPVLAVSIAGVCIAAIGIGLKSTPLYYAGLVLAAPLYIVYIPLMLFAIAATATWPLWIPFYRLAIKKHGAPFHAGDKVRVLRGAHRGRVLTVYAVWEERNQVRVDLGTNPDQDFTDVLSIWSVQKIN